MNLEEKRRLESNFPKFYLDAALAGFTFFYSAVVVLFYQSFDLSFATISFILAAIMITTLATEVLTGAFADLYGRKKSIVISRILLLVTLIILTFSSSFRFRTRRDNGSNMNINNIMDMNTNPIKSIFLLMYNFKKETSLAVRFYIVKAFKSCRYLKFQF